MAAEALELGELDSDCGADVEETVEVDMQSKSSGLKRKSQECISPAKKIRGSNKRGAKPDKPNNRGGAALSVLDRAFRLRSGACVRVS